MALQRIKLADIQTLPVATGVLFQNPAGKKTYIRGLHLFNGNASIETVKLYNVPDAAGAVGAAGATNQFREYAMASKEELITDWPYPVVLSDTNDSLQGSAATAGKVTVQILGDQE